MSGVFLCWRIIFCRSAVRKFAAPPAPRSCGTIAFCANFLAAGGTRSPSYSRSYAFVDAELRKRRPFGRRFLFSRISSCRSASGKCGDVNIQVYVVLKCEIECTSRGECCSPSFPSGIPPPLGKSAVLLKCGVYFSFFLIEFEFRIEIIERRTVFTERRSRGEEGDSTRTAPVST